ncbi:MAG TPA: tetratricopeptide repeat protein, partial [Pyrinomonadaceae bacterium]
MRKPGGQTFQLQGRKFLVDQSNVSGELKMMSKSPSGVRAVALAAAILWSLCSAASVLAQGPTGGAGSVSRDGGASASAKDVAGGAAVQATVKRAIARTQAASVPVRRRAPRPRTPAAGRRPVMDADDYEDQGDAFLSAGKYTEAINAYKQAVRLKPDLAEAHYSLGWIYNEQDNYAQALDSLKAALRYMADNAEAWKELGFAHRSLNQSNEAINAYR